MYFKYSEPIPLREEKMKTIVIDPNPWSVEYNPDTQPKLPEENYYGDLFMFSRRAIDYLNETHMNDYFELVDPLVFSEFRTNDWRDDYIQHLSFIARSHKYSHLKMFFAEFAHHGQIQICITVDPGNPLIRARCGAIYYPYDLAFGSGGGSRRLSTEHAYAKKFLRDVYAITSVVEELDSNDYDAYELKQRYEGHAFQALENFCSSKLKRRYEGHDFEGLKKFCSNKDASCRLVEVVSCNRFVCDDVSDVAKYWAHLTFMAKVRDGDGIESSSVLFFAEVGFATNYVYVTSCVIIPTADDSVPLSGEGRRCAVCPNTCPMFHPERGYVAGYEGGDFADSMYKGHFRAVKSKILIKDDSASRAAREEYYTYIWSGGEKSSTSSQRRTH